MDVAFLDINNGFKRGLDYTILSSDDDGSIATNAWAVCEVCKGAYGQLMANLAPFVFSSGCIAFRDIENPRIWDSLRAAYSFFGAAPDILDELCEMQVRVEGANLCFSKSCEFDPKLFDRCTILMGSIWSFISYTEFVGLPSAQHLVASLEQFSLDWSLLCST